MAYGHGGRREGAGRPQGASSHRNLLFGTLAAGLARKYDAEAVNTLASIMEDERAPSRTRLEAVREILDRGHGRPTPSNEPLEEQALPSASPQSPEEIVAELKRRGLFPVLAMGVGKLRREVIATGRRIRRSRNSNAQEAEHKAAPLEFMKSRARLKPKSGAKAWRLTHHMVHREDTILGDGTPNLRKYSKASSGSGHGGKRKRAGRPRSTSLYRDSTH
jgi:hypothetical protein